MPETTPTDRRLDASAEEDLGIDRLRSGQRQAASAAVEGRDVLAVMPSGYGKSAIYQLAAAEIEGPTLVVSPLLALQHDQIEGLEDADVGDAVQINSTLTDRQREEALERLRRGEVEFAFLAPEQLAREDTLAALRAARPTLVVVDEAHCISAWGHDFRPDYLRIGAAVEALGHPRVMALTATAAPPVQHEIVERLDMRDPAVVIRGFDRPNIHLEVAHMAGADAHGKDEAVLDRTAQLATDGRSGIVYVGTRARAESLAAGLVERGIGAAGYHAGMAKGRRAEVHDGFMVGDVAVVVATSAFGMGVDKPDVRFVVHADVADSLDSYSQEIGRAGRDGDPAAALLVYRPEDLGLRRFLGAGGGVDPDEVAGVVETVREAGHLDEGQLAERLDAPPRRLARVVTRLVDVGALSRDGGRLATTGMDPDAAVEAVGERDEERERLDATRLEMMRGYAETRTCRRRFLLTYFAEEHAGDCGYCDNCQSGRAAAVEHRGADDPFPVGRRVRHGEWGEGEVIRVEPDAVVVLFDVGGYRTLATELVAEKGLLELC